MQTQSSPQPCGTNFHKTHGMCVCCGCSSGCQMLSTCGRGMWLRVLVLLLLLLLRSVAPAGVPRNFHVCCDLQGRKINFTNSKTLVRVGARKRVRASERAKPQTLNPKTSHSALQASSRMCIVHAFNFLHFSFTDRDARYL